MLDWSKAVISAASALDDLSDSTGSTVEDLSKLANIARVSGTSYETLSTALQKLAVGLSGTDEESQKAGRALAALGISSRDPAKALEEVAKKFAQFADDANKTAYAVAIFGRAGAQLLPLLKDMANAQDIAATVTTKQAQEAEKLEKSFRALTVQSSLLKNALLSEVVPAINAAMLQFQQAQAAGFGFMKSLAFSGLDADRLGPFIEETKEKIESLERGIDRMKGKLAEDPRNAGLLGALNKQLDEYTKKLQLLQRFQANTLDVDFLNESKGARARSIGAPPVSTGTNAALKAAKDAVADYRDEIARLNDEMLALTGEDGGFTRVAAAARQIEKDLLAGKIVTNEQIDAYMNAARAADEFALALKRTEAAVKADIDGFEQMAKLRDDFVREQAKATAAIDALVDSLNLEADTMFMTNEERQKAVELSRLQKQYDDGLIPTQDALAAAVAKVGEAFERRDAALALRRSLDEQAAAFARTYNEVSNTITDSIIRGLENGGNSAKDFVNSLKALFANLVLRPVIQAAIAPLAGGLSNLFGAASTAGINAVTGGVPGLGNLLGLGNLGSLASSAAGGISSLFGANSFTAGLAGDAFLPGLLAGTGEAVSTAAAGIAGFGVEAAASGATLASFGAAAATAVPVIGAVIAGGLLLKGYLDSKGGGPKQGGSASIGDLTSTGLISGITPGRFGVDASINQQDAQLTTTVASIKSSFEGLLKAFGADVADASFGLAFDTDPKGTAANRVKAGVSIAGQSVYSIDTGEGAGNIGRDAAVLEQRLATEAKRMLLAALQASDLPTYLSGLFDGLEASTATAEQIDNVIAAAAAIKQAVELVPQLDSALANLRPEDIIGLVDAFGGIENLSASMKAFADNFTTAAEKTQQAQDSLIESFTELGLSVPDTHQEFKDLLNSFDLTTESGRKLYASVMSLSGAFVSVKGTADQAAQALKASFQEVSSLASSIKVSGKSGSGITAGSSSLAIETQLQIVRQQRDDLVKQFAGAGGGGGTAFLAQAGGAGGFVQNLANITEEDFSNYSEANQTLIKNILRSQQQLNQAEQDAAAAYASSASSGGGGGKVGKGADPEAQARDAANQLLATFKQLADLSTGNYGRKLALDLQFVSGALKNALPAQVPIFQTAAADLKSSIALFSSLQVQYGDAIAGSLVQLSEEYRAQQATLQGNATGLDALHQIFEERWNAIINGTADGVDGTLEQMARLREGILDYVDSLKINAESPLKPLERLAEAERQYQETLAKARTQDLDALADITNAAENLRSVGRDLFASGSGYTDIYNRIVSDLTALGTSAGTSATRAVTAAQSITAGNLADVDQFLTHNDAAIGASKVDFQSAAVTAAKESADQTAQTIAEAVYEAVMEAIKAGGLSTSGDSGKIVEAVEQLAPKIGDIVITRSK